MKNIRALFAVSTLLWAGQVQAATPVAPGDILAQFTAEAQSVFEGLSDDLTAAAWMTPSNSAEPHSAGFIPVGVQIALELPVVSIDPTSRHWQAMGAPADLTGLPVPRARLSVGIPFGFDVGMMYLSAPDLNLKLVGYEARFAFGGMIPLPFLEANVRVHTSTLSVDPDLEVVTKGAAVMIGADLPFIKPYVEIGVVDSTATPSGQLVSGPIKLHEYKTNNRTLTLGAKLQLALFILNVEKSQVGDKDVLSAKLGFEF